MARAALIVAFALAAGGLSAGCAASGDPLPLGASRGDCASCHAEQAEAFERSPHAHSDTSPVLAAMLPHVRDAWGAAAADRCVRCHNPSHAQLLGDTSAETSVTCVSCHAAVGNRGTRDGRLVVDPSIPIAGPFADAEPSPAHATRRSELLASPTLCGSCHEVSGPGFFVETTFDEHVAASPDPADPSCVGCHMPSLEPAPIALDASRARPRRSHLFVGLDPPWGASEAERDRATLASTELLRAALSLRVEREAGRAAIGLSNVGASHDVPTGATLFRDVWVDVEIATERGVEEHRRVIVLGDRPMRGDEAVALATDADRVEPHRLARGEERVATLDAPSGARVTARLRARAVREEVIAALALEAHAEAIPILEVAEVSR